MPEQMYKLELTAQGEIHDQDGNLISSEPVTGVAYLTADQVRELTEGETE